MVNNVACVVCWRVRGCPVRSCKHFNAAPSVTRCSRCARYHRTLLTEARAASTCPAHTTEDARVNGLCYTCANEELACHVCQIVAEPGDAGAVACAECGACGAVCNACRALVGSAAAQCGACWKKLLRCLLCAREVNRDTQRAHRHRHLCQRCENRLTCSICRAWPPGPALPPSCRLCDRAAAWCADHFSQKQRNAGYCNIHMASQVKGGRKRDR